MAKPRVTFDNGSYVEFDSVPSPEMIQQVVDQNPDLTKPKMQLKTDLTPSTNTQESGFVPTEEDLKGFLPGKKDILPMAGLMIGGLSGGIPGASLGYAAGNAYNQLGQRAGVIPGEAPQTSKEAALDIGKGAVKGAMIEAGNKFIVNPALSKIGEFMLPAADVATQGAVKAAEEQGIKALPSMISKSKAVSGGERVLEYSPFGTTITKARDKAVEDFGNFANRVGDKISPSLPPEVNGTLNKEAVNGFYDAYNEVKNKLYNSVMPQIKDKPVDTDELVGILKSTIATAKDRGENGVSSYVEGVLNKIEEGRLHDNIYDVAEPPTFSKVKDIATGIGQRAKFHDPANPGMQSNLKYIWGQFQDALDNTIENHADEATKIEYNKAKDYFSNGKMVLKSKVYKAITSAPHGMEYKIAFSANDPMAYDLTKEVVGKEQVGGMARQWFDSIIKDPAGNMRSPIKILNDLNKNSSVISRMAGDFPEATAQIEKLKQVATLMSKNRDVTKGSITAPLGSMIGTIAEIAYNIPRLFVEPHKAAVGLAAGLGVLGASKLGAEAVTSDFARNLLTKGYPVAQKGVESVVGTAVRPTAYLGVKGTGNYLKNKEEALKAIFK